MKILSVIGARPQFVKAACVSRALRRSREAQEILLHTGQHYDENLSDIFFREMEIPKPDHQLGIGSASHGAQTGRMLEALESVLLAESPDWVLVYGDTNSTLAGSLAAAKLHIPVAHIEAGLRSFNRRMPEEINRVVTDHLAELLFTPTDAATRNLTREGIAAAKVHRVGDVMYDAAQFYGTKAERASTILSSLAVTPRDYVLATIHRAENTDCVDRLSDIFNALGQLSRTFTVVMPLHPRTRAALQAGKVNLSAYPRLRLIDPVGYLDMVMLEKNSRLIVTDSGGVQKEAYFYAVPCATLREETEWTELVDCGWNTLVPPFDATALCQNLLTILDRSKPAEHHDLYGTGDSAEKILNVMLETSV